MNTGADATPYMNNGADGTAYMDNGADGTAYMKPAKGSTFTDAVWRWGWAVVVGTAAVPMFIAPN